MGLLAQCCVQRCLANTWFGKRWAVDSPASHTQRNGAERIDDMLKKKQLSVNNEKSKFMVLRKF